MKKFKWWSLLALAAAGWVLSGCGGGNSESSDKASLRLANATLTHPSLDLLANSSKIISGTSADTVSAYVGPSSGSNTLQLNDAGSATALATTVPSLTGGAHYTVLAYETGGSVKTVILNEDYAVATAGTVQMRIFNAATDAGRLDVYITAPGVDLASVAPTASFTNNNTLGPLTYSAGTYRVRVTGYGNKSDLRMDIPSVTLTSLQFATIVLTPTSGGSLINGSTLIQQGSYAATRNPNARVRLAASFSEGGTSVAASAGSSVIDSGSVAPVFGFYALVPASSPLSISVNGGPVAAPATALVAGSDSTLLVYGSAASPTASLISDDNRLPADATTVKLRLINGITGNVGALTLTANAAPVGTGIAAGAASSYATVASSVNPMKLTLTSPLIAGNYYSDSTNVLNANTVYTVLAGGDVSVPQLLIR